MESSTNRPSNIHHITLHIKDIRQLFEESAFDPFAEQSDYLSGFERIFKDIRQKQPKGEILATISLPTDRISDDIERICAAAFRRTCDVHIEQIDDELASIRWEGTRSLWVGLVVWAACLFLALFFAELEKFPEFPRLFLSDGFIIAGWVALWYPVEIILYEWWLQLRDKKVYERMKNIKIKVVRTDGSFFTTPKGADDRSER
jgi:hypothetical protein